MTSFTDILTDKGVLSFSMDKVVVTSIVPAKYAIELTRSLMQLILKNTTDPPTQGRKT